MARETTKGTALGELLSVSLLLVLIHQARGDIHRTVDDILQHNNCTCQCKPTAVKEYYIAIRRTSDWFGAAAYCHSVGMEMAEVLNAGEADTLREAIAEEDDDDTVFYWIGANDLALPGRHTWALTGRTVTYTNWADREPKNVRERKDDDNSPMKRCAAIAKASLKWNEFQCKQQKKFVCQRFRDD